MKRTMLLSAAVVIAVAAGMGAQTAQPAPRSLVPSVGCKADGQTGPLKAPSLPGKYVAVGPEVAKRLAYYQAMDGPGVLGPRGWHCFEAYGSSGEALYVAPVAIGAKELFSGDWKGFTGNAIELSVDNGDTSGRFEVAQMIARVFPDYMRFVRRVIAQGVAPASSFPTGPYAKDELTYKSKEMVEYVTPADSDGLGTRSRLLKNSDAISGVAILSGEELSLAHLSMRLPEEMNDLMPVIISQTEQDVAAKER